LVGVIAIVCTGWMAMATKTKGTKGAVYVINYHLVRRPKYRRVVLTGMGAVRLSELFKEIANK
jgi:REP element-mobilizing transposase RayT